jgi:acetyl esterase/lipase
VTSWKAEDMRIDRRTLIGFAAASGAGAAAPALSAGDDRQEVLSLWPGAPPAGPGPSGAEQLDEAKHPGAVSNVVRPTLRVFRPARPNGAAVMIAGGGGYRRIENGPESFPAAQWLAGQGVTAFVLTYRLPREGWSTVDVPFQDAQRGLRLIRANAARWAVDPGRIGVLGFSAGGHLMGTLAVRPDAPFYAPADTADRVSARPDFAALAYPVITLKPPFDLTVTRRTLVGESPSPAQAEAYSVETHVSDRTPPTFLVQAADDPIAPVDNSLLMFAALRRAKVRAEVHIFEQGGHGFALGEAGTPLSSWPSLFMRWAAHDHFI